MNTIESSMEKLQTMVELWRSFPTSQDAKFEKKLRQRFIDEVFIPRINDVFQAKFLEIDKWHEIRAAEGEEETKFVVHYTGLDTLLPVLRNYAEKGKTFLRMYDSFHLNDPEEGSYIAIDSDLNIGLTEKKASLAYITSFVIYNKEDDKEFGDEDNLTYWLAYGRRGRGCSIMIPVRHNRFRRVLYGRDKAQRTLEKLDIPSVLDCLTPVTAERPYAQRRIYDAIQANLEQVRYLYKPEPYSYEKECRLVKSGLDIADPSEVSFEPEAQADSSYRVRHYYEDSDLSIDEILVTESWITLGPLVTNPNNMTHYIKRLLKKAGLEGPKIKVSKVPYQER